MTITIDWDDQLESVMLITFVGSWTWTDFDESMSVEAEMAATLGAEPYDIIADMTLSPLIPWNTGLNDLRRTVERSPSNWNSTVVVNGNEFVRLLIQTLSFVSPRSGGSTHYARTVDEARERIMQARQTTSA